MPQMRASLLLSVSLHAAILAVGLVEFAFHKEKSLTTSVPIPVDLVTTADLTRIKAGEREAKKPGAAVKPKEVLKKTEATEPAPKPKKRKTVAKRAPAPKPEPKAEKAPSVKKAKAAKPKPKKKPVAKPKNVVRAQKKKPAKRRNDKIAALLNKIPDSAPETPKAAPKKPAPKGQGRRDGGDARMTRSEIDALRARIAQCWSPPVGASGAAAFSVRLRLRLNEDGSLTQSPQVMNYGSSPIFRAAADSAVRAVWECQPYQLSPAKYGQWRDMVLNFDPREMVGG